MAAAADRGPLEIVLTGGACGGKTTALSALAHLLRTRGVHPITVPEAFTLIVSGGVSGVGDMVRADGSDNCRFQAELFRTIRRMRRNARTMAEQFAGQPTVILYDRGELDAIAFHDHSCFDDAVMHLVTTADGAEEFYSAVTNLARWETVDEARASDHRILDAWSGHVRHLLIDNSTDFDGKIARLLDAVLATVDDLVLVPAGA